MTVARNSASFVLVLLITLVLLGPNSCVVPAVVNIEFNLALTTGLSTNAVSMQNSLKN